MRRGDQASRHGEVLLVVRRIRARWRMRLALKGLSIVLGATLVAFLLSVYGLEKLRFTPEAVIGFRVVLWGSVIVLTARFLAWPLMRRVTDEQAALYLEEHEPSLEASIISALETGRESGAGGASQAMVDKLVEQALERAREVDYGVRIERQGLYRASGALASVGVGVVLFMLLGPVQLRHGAFALLNPTRSANAVNPYSVAVLPGDVTIARGSDQMVTAELGGFESGEAKIYLRGESRGGFDRITMLPGNTTAFEILLLALNERTEYFVESEGIRSATHTIEVADLPYVDRLELEYDFPSYTGLAPRVIEDGGDIAALRGTQVTVHVFPTMITPGGRLLVDGEPLELEDEGDGTWSGSLRVEEEGFYEIELAMADGTLVPASPQYTIDVLDDQPPSVSFSKPGRDFRASPIEEVFLEAKADDDYGISELVLVYSANGGAEDTISLFNQGGSPMSEVTAGHTLYLEELDLESGDLISYYAIARDNRRGAASAEVTSDIYFLQIRPFRIDFRQADQAGGGGAGGGMPAAALSELQKQVVAATFNVIRDGELFNEDDFDENVVSVQLAQSRVREQVEALHQRMVGRGIASAEPAFRRIAQMLPEAVEEMKRAEVELEKGKPRDALAPEQRALVKLQKAEETYERYVQQGGQNQGGSGGANAEDLADLFELELDKLKNQYETVQRGERQQRSQQLDETLEKLKELARRQQQEAERQRRRVAANQSASGGGGRSQRALADETDQAARQLERLVREINNPQLEQTARELQNAADAMRRSASSSGSQGIAEANAALDRIEEARRRLKRDQTDRLTMDVQDAQRRVDELARTQEGVERDMQRLEGAVDPQELARRLMERKEAMWREVGDLKNELNRLADESRAEQRDASERLREASQSIVDNKLEERVRYSRGLVGARDQDYIREFEGETGRAIEDLQQRLQEAGQAIGESSEDRRAEALDKTRDLVRGLESAQRRLEERSSQGQQGVQGTGDPQTEAGGSTPTGGGGVVRGNFNADDIRQFRREFRERAREAAELRRDIDAMNNDEIDSRQLNDVVQALRALDADRIYDDPDEVARLQAQIVEGLKQLEFGLRRDLEGFGQDRAALTGSDEVPSGFRKLVEEYYKALSQGRRGGSGG
jgi:uncharacterized protein DUF4175